MTETTLRIRILTEENPQSQEVSTCLGLLGYPVSSCVIAIGTDCNLIVTTDRSDITCTVSLFSGTTSSVDYICFVGENPTPVLLLESTKTDDASSRNSAWYQRLIKFLVAKHYYPDADYVMYYTGPISERGSKSSLFGKMLMATIGVKIYDSNGLVRAEPFDSIDQLLHAKNIMGGPSHNTPVRISRNGSTIIVKGRLNKTDGRMDYDPNIGLMTGIISAINSLEKGLNYMIENHGLDISKIGMNNKFWFALDGINVTINGFNRGSPTFPTNYFTEPRSCEKMATISFERIINKYTVFHNHAGCQKSYLKDLSGTDHIVPKKITMPDVVIAFLDTKTLFVAEGKDASKTEAAQKQLDNLTQFDELLRVHYGDYSIKRGLIIHQDSSFKGVLRYPVWLTLFPDGMISNTFTT